jgi:xyloglucan-specific endo-beta-1,4-glucanase
MLRGLTVVVAVAATVHGAAVGTRTTAAAAALCSQYAYQSVNGYDLLNNLWGISTATGGSQCTNYDGAVGSGIAFSSEWTWQGDQNTVKSYIYAGRQFTRKKVSEIRSLPTTVEWSYNSSDIRANVAYDIFTHPDADHVNYNGEFELMIW